MNGVYNLKSQLNELCTEKPYEDNKKYKRIKTVPIRHVKRSTTFIQPKSGICACF